MKTLEQDREMILSELWSDDAEVRRKYRLRFDDCSQEFSDSMARAFVKWRAFDDGVQGDEKIAHVSALVYSAITLHILSLKLILSGQTIAAGSLFRQVVESIALALLCSGKDLRILQRFMDDKYSSHDAVGDVLRNAKTLSLNGEALRALRESQRFYHQYSHITKMTIAIGMSLSDQGSLYVGASFDDGKIEAYTKEVHRRVSLAAVFANFVDGVTVNVGKWSAPNA